MKPNVLGQSTSAASERTSADACEESQVSGTPSVDWDWRRARSLLGLLALVCALEGADQTLLPVCFHAIEEDLHLGPSKLGVMALAQAAFQANAAPIWGIVADRGCLSRRAVLSIGCLGWGLVTLALASVSTFFSMVLLRALNGVMLSCLTPISAGIIADVAPSRIRGRLFGLIDFSLMLGQMAASLFATPMSSRKVAGVQGWRVAFTAVGLLSLVVAAVVALWMQELPREIPESEEVNDARPANSVCKQMCEEAQRLRQYFMIPTFCVIILQGVFGCMPWNALGFATMYFQLSGLKDGEASMLISVFLGVLSLGHLLGGVVGDCMALRWPRHGRAITAQVSVSCGIPCVVLLFGALPIKSEMLPLYVVVNVFFGLTASWCGSGVNRPILTEIVDADNRSIVMAWDRALEGSFSAFLGAPAVGFLAEQLFGYSLRNPDAPGQLTSEQSRQNAHALGRALLVATTGPWLLCLAFFSFLHWSYPRDMAKVSSSRELQSQKKRGAHGAKYVSVAGHSHEPGRLPTSDSVR